jgi:hypothetical protein
MRVVDPASASRRERGEAVRAPSSGARRHRQDRLPAGLLGKEPRRRPLPRPGARPHASRRNRPVASSNAISAAPAGLPLNRNVGELDAPSRRLVVAFSARPPARNPADPARQACTRVDWPRRRSGSSWRPDLIAPQYRPCNDSRALQDVLRLDAGHHVIDLHHTAGEPTTAPVGTPSSTLRAAQRSGERQRSFAREVNRPLPVGAHEFCRGTQAAIA